MSQNRAGMTRANGGVFFGKKEKPLNTKETLQRLWVYFKEKRVQLIFINLTVVVQTLLLIMIPFLVGRAVDSLGIDGAINNILILLVGVHLVNVTISVFQGWSMARISQQIVKSMRDILFNKLQRLPVSYFDTTAQGELMSRLTNDIDNVSSTISSSLIALISGLLTLVGTLVMMLVLSPVLTAAALVIVPLVFLLTKSVAKKTKELFRLQQKTLGKLNGMIEESISGVEVVRAFNQEENILQNFDEMNEVLKNIGVKAMIFSGFLMPLMNVISNFGFTVVTIFGAIIAINGYLSVGVIAAFLTYSRQFSRPLNEIANIFNTLQSAIAGAERVFQVMDEEEEEADLDDAISAGTFNGDVCFKNVSFGYKEDNLIIKDFSLSIDAGLTVALVGQTGAGKTTIANLLTRFYEINSGEILIDGTNIKQFTRKSLRENFGMVLQDTYLFHGTIKENIRYGRLDATDDEIINAATRAASHDFIRALPDGYETMLVEGGNNLSQGQRQLLAITRAILANPSILILDEATSSIDTRTELIIGRALLELMKGRTSFVIAHRLSTIREADIIVVIEDGMIKEMGSHEQLLRQKEVYYSMYSSQYVKDNSV